MNIYLIFQFLNNNIDIRDMITGSGLSIENYSKFLIALKQSLDNNPSRLNTGNFYWNINQYYNSSASLARSDLVNTYGGFFVYLGQQ